MVYRNQPRGLGVRNVKQNSKHSVTKMIIFCFSNPRLTTRCVHTDLWNGGGMTKRRFKEVFGDTVKPMTCLYILFLVKLAENFPEKNFVTKS